MSSLKSTGNNKNLATESNKSNYGAFGMAKNKDEIKTDNER